MGVPVGCGVDVAVGVGVGVPVGGRVRVNVDVAVGLNAVPNAFPKAKEVMAMMTRTTRAMATMGTRWRFSKANSSFVRRLKTNMRVLDRVGAFVVANTRFGAPMFRLYCTVW